jgi:glycosyltransferase involved in cell wall biosynthesis
MRFFVDCRWFAQPNQGVVTFLVGLHEALVSRQLSGMEQDIELVLGVIDRTSVPDSLRNPDIEIVELGAKSFLWRFFVLPFRLRRLNIDVAHFQYSIPFFKLGMKYIVTIHDVLFLKIPEFFSITYRLLRIPFFYHASKIADSIITVSDSSAADLQQYLHVSRSIDVVYNGLDSSLRSIAPSATATLNETKFILTVGRLEPRKNYERLTRAFSASKAKLSGVQLVIVGFCAPEFESVAREIEDTEGVIWLSGRTDSELNWLYNNAKAFIYPSLAEGFGIPVLEAMRANLPCAISNTYPLEDVLAACPITFDPYNESDMKLAIDQLIDQPELTRSVETVLQHYTWATSCIVYVDIVRRLMGTKVKNTFQALD